MTLRGPEFKKALLLGLVVSVVPLSYYPKVFGWSGAATGSPLSFLFEFTFYLMVFGFFFTRESWASRMQAAAFALGFRLGLGVVFAVLAAIVYGQTLGTAL